MTDLARLDATAQAELVRKGEVKPSELVEAAIQRIEKVNGDLNAVITPMFEIALDAAVGEIPDGPFTGVPYLIKDLTVEYAGVAYSEGTKFLEGYVSEEDSEFVTRLKKAGFLITGKTNTPEFGLLPTTEPVAFGRTRNPWNLEHSTGGSSGGSAAAVAARTVPAAHGNDGGGSIRIPASCCGLFGLKVTRARNSSAPKFGDIMSGLAVDHALTVSVRDSAAILDATSGPALGDPYWAPPPARPFIKEVGADPGKLRIALVTQAPTGVPVHEDCVAAVRDAAQLCESLGHSVEEVPIELDTDADTLTQNFITVFSAEVDRAIKEWERKLGKQATKEFFEPLTWAAFDLGKGYTSGDYLLAIQGLQKTSRFLATRYDQFDLWLTPTLSEPPLRLGECDSPEDNPLYGWIRASLYVPFTAVANFTGQPGASIPLYWNSEDLPIGVQVMAKFGDEATIFRIASQLEQARPWAGRIPPVSAV